MHTNTIELNNGHRLAFFRRCSVFSIAGVTRHTPSLNSNAPATSKPFFRVLPLSPLENPQCPHRRVYRPLRRHRDVNCG